MSLNYVIEPKLGLKPKVVIYKRVSDKRMSLEGHSIKVQEDILIKLATDKGWEVLKIFEDDGKSARTLDRKDMQDFLGFCDEHGDSLDAALIQDTSRLCRNVEDHLAVKTFLKKRNIQMLPLDGVVTDGTPENDFIDLIIAGVNELESKRTGKKTKRVMLALFEQGLKPGPAPIGYINSYVKNTPMRPDPEKRIYIEKAFELWCTGNYALDAISEVLYKDGFRSKYGKVVAKSGIKEILQRIDYAGGLSYDGEINKEAQHKAIISMETYERAQKMFKIRNKGADRSRKHNTLLAGMVHCFRCGNLMYGEYHEKGKYYKCKKCGSPYAKMDYIDEQVAGFFEGSHFSETGLAEVKQTLIDIKNNEGSSIPQQKKSLEARRKALDIKMRKLEDKLLFQDEGSIDKERLEAMYEPMKKEMKQVEEQLKALDTPSSNLKDADVEKVIKGLGQMGDIYKALTKNQKKQFLKYFVRKVFVDCSENKIADYELVPEFETVLSKDLVRIKFNWLPRLDSNQQPFA
jgi:site-specific DNA recombinase